MKDFEAGKSNGSKALHRETLKFENNKSLAAENANRQFRTTTKHSIHKEINGLNSALYNMVDPFDDMGKANDALLTICNAKAKTFDGIT